MKKSKHLKSASVKSILLYLGISSLLSVLIYLLLLIIFSYIIVGPVQFGTNNPIERIDILLNALRNSGTDVSLSIYHISQASILSLGVLTGTGTAILALRKHIITEKNQLHQEEKSLLDRFNQSLSLLFDDNPEARIVSIHTLEQIAYESDFSCTIVVDALTNWFRKQIKAKNEFKNIRYIDDLWEKTYRTVKDLPFDVYLCLQSLTRIAKSKHISLDFSNLDLSGVYIGALNLSDVNLYNTDLHGTCFVGAILKRANLQCSILDDADLKKADLTKASLTGAHCVRTNLRGASLKSACIGSHFLIQDQTYIVNSYLNGADLRGAYLGHVDLTASQLCQAKLTGASFEYAILDKANLYNLDTIKHVNFESTFMRGIKDVSRVRFCFCNFDLSSLEGIDFSKASFKFCSLRSASLSESDISNTRFFHVSK